MAVNSGIIILVTRRCDKKKGFEYRVAHTLDVDGLTTNPDYTSADHPVINREFTLKTFGNSRIMFNEAEAIGRAKLLEMKKGPTTKGIIQFNYQNINFPAYRTCEKKVSQMPQTC